MKQKLVIIASVLTLALSAAPEVSAQWVKTSLPDNSANAFAELGSFIFAGGFGQSGGYVYRSSDNGMSWNLSTSGIPQDAAVFSLAEISSNLFAAGSGVYLSTDSGTTWFPRDTGLQQGAIFALATIGTNLFATSDGVALSTDSGKSWSSVDAGIANQGTNALAVIGTNLFVAADSGVYRSTDSGKSWNSANNGLSSYIEDIYGLAAMGTNMFTGTAAGVFRSTDSGVGWTAENSGLPSLYSGGNVLAVSSTNLFTAPVGGGVFLSTDSGTTWTAVGLTDTFVQVLAVCCTNLFAVTNESVYLRPLSQMIGSSSVAPNPPIQSSFTAFPNPLTQSTTINFTSPENGSAEVTILNLLGAEVARIYSGEMDAGTHSFTWDASAMPPGTYWCEIRMNGTAAQIPVVLQR